MWSTCPLLILILSLSFFPKSLSTPLETYEINLDLDPSVRYAGLFDLPNTNFNETVWKFYDEYFKDDEVLTDVLYGIAEKRGKENEEQQAEIEGETPPLRLLRFSQTSLPPCNNESKKLSPHSPQTPHNRPRYHVQAPPSFRPGHSNAVRAPNHNGPHRELHQVRRRGREAPPPQSTKPSRVSPGAAPAAQV